MGRMSDTKISKISVLAKTIRRIKKEHKKIVLCHGVFDLIHPGHIRHLQSAKEFGDILVVTIIADKHVNKGPGRPIFHEDLRAEVIASLEFVDYVAIVNSETAKHAINLLIPDVYVKGAEHKNRRTNPLSQQQELDEEKAIKAVDGLVQYTDDIVYSSSHLINQYLAVYPTRTKQFLTQFRKKYSDAFVIEKLAALRKLSVLVIGDAIIDQYYYSKPMGKSTKEPIAVHKYLSEESFAGGALAAANHVSALSENVTLLTLLGKKKSFEGFIRKHLRSEVSPKFFYKNNSGTIIKRRFIDELTKQKLFQISYIKDEDVDEKLESSVIDWLKGELPKYDVVIVNDFGHGFVTKRMIKTITALAKFLAVNVQANSANFGFNVVTKYPRADFVCIDDTELRLAMHDRYGNLNSLVKRIGSKLKCKEILVTKGQHGSVAYSKKDGYLETPSLTDKVVDRVGAGDALFAISSPLVAMGFERELVGFVGNVAGALHVQTVGNKRTMQFDEMAKFITRLLK